MAALTAAALALLSGTGPAGAGTHLPGTVYDATQQNDATAVSGSPNTYLTLSGDGVKDNHAALANALGNLHPGETLYLPGGTYNVDPTYVAVLSIPAGVTIEGSRDTADPSKRTVLSLVNTYNKGRDCVFLRNGGDNVTIQDLTVQRSSPFPVVLFEVKPYDGLAVRRCHFDGKRQSNAGDGDYCDALYSLTPAGSVTKNLLVDGCSFENLDWGFLMPGQSRADPRRGDLTNVTFSNCTFSANAGDGIGFNAPSRLCRDVAVDRCTFTGLGASSPAPWVFAVSLANVQQGRVTGCTISNYPSEGLHIEDRSAFIDLSQNTLSSCCTGTASYPAGNGGYYVIVGNESHDVHISNNTIDARANPFLIYGVNLTAGGANAVIPNDITIFGNTFHFQPGTGSKTFFYDTGVRHQEAGNVNTGGVS
jgi:hypothetical protein